MVQGRFEKMALFLVDPLLMDRVYHFSDVNEKGNCYQLVMLMDRGYSMMQMNWPFLVTEVAITY
jgi:hypothetical protein